jgi:hypothetical protein
LTIFLSADFSLKNSSQNKRDNCDRINTDDDENFDSLSICDQPEINAEETRTNDNLILKYNRLLEKFNRAHKQLLNLQSENDKLKKTTLRKRMIDLKFRRNRILLYRLSTAAY